MEYLVTLYDTTERLLTDTGGEFINDEFITFCETLNVNIHSTIEIHSLVLSEIINKVLEEV